ncbi:protein-glutamine glutaminase family protein [Chryseobacterium viscerum]|uniref:Protein glutaminase domain-containing protein n=1 Tax=Chryseobacterium viscerum TaxID=1037377 RepID=A0A5N4BVQ0_9FLAO|nr:protein-glutamine glutaminase family protein [Chryseobacterium viscerum]KAB1232514.1 hypothetical protein F8D52_01755 [Chryseobacterium viscerum]
MKHKLILFLLVAISFAPKTYAQAYFDLTRDFPSNGNQNYLADFKTIQTYSPTKVKQVFDSISKSGIEFNYPQGGCQNRAQIMSMLLDKKFNIQHCKVWLFSPADLYVGNTKSLEIYDKNQLSPDNTIKWLYHVAPCVLVNDNGKIDTLVIDPSIDNSQPLKLSNWLKKIKNSDVSKYTFLNPKLYFFDTNNNIISGVFYKFDIDPRYANDSYRELTLEKSLAINDLAIYILNKYIIPLRTSTQQSDLSKLAELKKLFSNIAALTQIFGSQESYLGTTFADNIYPRNLFENYPEIMNDAMKFYIDKYGSWTKRVAALK